MVWQGTMHRFTQWGIRHGPAWGILAAAIGAVPLVRGTDLSLTFLELLVAGAVAGLVLGPLLGALVGAACLAAERVPRWLLDAPDYVAVVTVIGVVALIAWPALQFAGAGTAITLLCVALLATPPTVDAARSVPHLLHPSPRP